MQIDFNDEANRVTDKEKKRIKKLLEFTAQAEGLSEDIEVSITLVNDVEIQEINRDYRQIDQPTDVISFAFQDEDTDDLIAYESTDKPPTMLGDLIVSVETAERQAADYNHAYERELSFLIVHGFLHLLGYDHSHKKDEQIMFTKQNEILEAFGIER